MSEMKPTLDFRINMVLLINVVMGKIPKINKRGGNDLLLIIVAVRKSLLACTKTCRSNHYIAALFMDTPRLNTHSKVPKSRVGLHKRDNEIMRKKYRN